MKNSTNLNLCKSMVIAFVIVATVFANSYGQQIPYKISYQGKLLENNVEFTGTKNFIFTIGGWSEPHNNVPISNGLYSVTLGETIPIPSSTFNSPTVTLQINVEGSPLTPQTDILSVPFAYKAETAESAAPTGTAGGDLSGTYPNPVVDGLQNRPVAATLPNSGEVLKWNGSQWAPQADNTGGLTLPYSAIYNGAPYAFDISSQGTGGIARFYIPSNNAIVLYASTDGDGIVGRFISNSSSAASAVQIDSWSNIKAALEVDNSGSGGAADFWGDVEMWDNLNIVGLLSKGGGTFKIDHPLDPENKYLYHSFVESPDMMNVYNGNIILDGSGEAIVVLPEWFEALNMEFRYQLTCIGGYAPIYISEEITNNSFRIAGGTAGMKISWQVTGIRQDPYAVQHRIQVEVEKTGKERGKYLHYKEYNQPLEKSMRVIEHPELLDKLNNNK